MPETITIDKKQFDELVSKLEKISNLLALNLVNGCQKQKDKILMLSSLGFGVTEIANLLNTTKGTANQALIRARKEKVKEQGESAATTKQDHDNEVSEEA
jgi:hypothetical protein